MKDEKNIEEKIPSASIWTGGIAWMVKNNVAANILMWTMLVGGLICLFLTKQEVMPEFEVDMVTVTLTYSGATPEEMEHSMVLAVEASVQSVEGVKEITSVVRSGSATVTIEATEGLDRQKFLQDIQNEVSRISTFPDEADTPTVVLRSMVREVMTIVLSGSNDMLFLREWGDIIEDELLAQPNITQVELDNTLDKEISVEIKEDVLRRYGLTLSDVASALSSASIEQGSGTMETSAGDINIKVDDRRDYAHEFGQVAIISLSDGSRVLLEDIATIKEDFEDSKSWAEFNGTPALLIEVYRIGEQTPAVVASEAKEVIDRLNQTMPAGLRLDIRKNDADTFIERAELLSNNALLGIILVFICLALFLEPKLAFWVSLGIPISIMGSFLFINPYGVTINMISMFAFILTLGIVVDDAIVVGENVHIWRRKGYTRGEAAVLGTKEIGTPIIFSVLTNIVAFIPIMMLPGFMGLMFACIVPVVSLVFFCSLIESLYVLPCHLAHDKKPKPGTILAYLTSIQGKFSVAFTRGIEKVYGPLLKCILKYKYSVLAICISLLILSGSYILSGRMGIELMPVSESDYAYVEIVLPTGTSKETLREVGDQVYESARITVDENGGDELSLGIYVSSFGTTVQGRIFLTASDIRPLSTTEVTEIWQANAPIVPGAETISFMADKGGPGSGKALTIRLAHKEIAVLEEVSELLAVELRKYPNTADVDTGASKQNKEYIINITPLGEQLGFTSSSLSTQVRAAFQGVSAITQQRGSDEITVRVRLPEEDRKNEETLNSLIVRTPDNEEVFLRDIATVTEDYAPAMIRRVDGQRNLAVSANVNPRNEATLILNNVYAEILPDLASRYPGLTWSQGGMQKNITENMDSLYTGLVLVLLAIYVLLAIPFKSYTQPFIIMVAIPFGIVGAVVGHIIMGYSLSIMSFMGILALCGLVVNDSLVLISFANNEKNKGVSPALAVYSAGIRRFRPIFLTTVTTAVGLTPMLLETSRDARMLIPVAISLGFGVLFATVITLALVPALYLILDELIPKSKPIDINDEDELLDDEYSS